MGIDRSQDYLFSSKGQLTDSGYVVEMRIPFKSLRYPGGKEMTWGFNVVRSTQRSGFEDTWTSVRRGSASFLSQSGLLTGLQGLRRGVVTEVQPFITASAAGLKLEDGRFDRGPVDPEYGVNFRLGFTNLAIDGTVNPDFSQVESDAGLVTLNERFALFFPERRPFFLEGIELFSTPGSLVYTRQVANPIAGGKLTGKFGRIGLAHLTALDEEVDPEDTTRIRRSFSTITRIRNDIGRNSLAGATFTNRSIGREYSRLAEADARFIIKDIYALNLEVGRSWTRDSTGTRSGPLWSAGFDRSGRSWGFNTSIEGRSENFEARLGFVPRVGDVSVRAFNRYTFFGRPGGLFESFTLFGGFNRIWDYEGFTSGGAGPVEGEQSLSAFGRLRGGWNYGGSARLGFVEFDPSFYEGAQVPGPGGTLVDYLGPDRLRNATDFSANVSSPNLRVGSANVRVSLREVGIFSEAAVGQELNLSGSVDFRPTPSVRLEARGTFSRITRRRDGSEFGRTIIPRLRLEVQPDRKFFLRVIAEYRSQRRDALRSALDGQPLHFDGEASAASRSDRLRVDWLLSFQPSPGTVAFLGYGSSYEGDRTLTLSNLIRQDDSFFLKLAYQFRR